MAKSRASGAGVTSQIGNRITGIAANGVRVTYTYAGNGAFLDDNDNRFNIKDISGGLKGLQSRLKDFEVLPPKKRTTGVEYYSRSGTRDMRLRKKSKASGARLFTR